MDVVGCRHLGTSLSPFTLAVSLRESRCCEWPVCFKLWNGMWALHTVWESYHSPIHWERGLMFKRKEVERGTSNRCGMYQWHLMNRHCLEPLVIAEAVGGELLTLNGIVNLSPIWQVRGTMAESSDGIRSTWLDVQDGEWEMTGSWPVSALQVPK